MKPLFTTLAFVFCLNANAQNCTPYQWAKRTDGIGLFNGGNGISSDAWGNVFVTGYFSGTAAFGTTTLVATNNNVFIVKSDSLGNVLWAKQTGGTGNAYGNSVSTDALGNVFVTGQFQGTATFGTSTLTSAGHNDIFIAKYDATGNLLWVKQAGGTGNDAGISVSTDALGNVFVTGSFRETATFGITILTPVVGNYNVFIAKYDATGNLLWAEQAGGTEGSNAFHGQSVSSDALGNVFVTGFFIGGTAVFGSTTLTATGNRNVFVAKYDATGNVLWAKQTTGNANADGRAITTDVLGNVFVTGYFNGTAAFGTNTLNGNGTNMDIFVAKYDASGNVLWFKQAGGTSNDYGYGISSDASGNAFVTGSFVGTVTFGSTTLTAANNNVNIFVAKYDAAGNVLWVKQAGGTNLSSGQSVSSDIFGNVFVTGYFRGTVAFDTTTLTASDNHSALFVAKLSPTPKLSITGSGTICVNETANITVNGATTYTWSTHENGASINVTPSVNTTYFVQGTGTNGCENSTVITVFVDECLGIGKFKFESLKLSVYPNPVSEIINVELEMINGGTDIKIIDVLGKEMPNEKFKIENGTAQINVSNIPKGIYFIKVGNAVSKFVKE